MRIINKILKLVFLLAIAIVLLGVGFTFLYGEKIEQIILSKIMEKSEAEIKVKEVNFSVFENFPYTSIKLTDVLIMEKQPNINDSLLYAKQAYLQFNIFNLLSENQEISKVVLLNSKLNIKYDMNGNPNFKIFKPPKEKEKKVKINQIYFNDSKISYIHQLKNIDIKGEPHKVLVDFEEYKQTDFSVNGDFFMQNLVVGETDYIYKKECKIDAGFSVSDEVFYIKNSALFIEDVQFSLAGEIEGKNVNLDISAENQKVKSVLSHMPEKFKSVCSTFSADGDLSCKGIIKGKISKTSNPHFDMDFNLTNGDFKLKENPFHLSTLQLSGNIDNGSSNNFENTLIKVENCSAKTENGRKADKVG